MGRSNVTTLWLPPEEITQQLGLEQHGTIVSDEFPPVGAFDEGRVRDAVRVYAGEDPDVVTLADGSGVIGGVTGALCSECYHREVPAAVLIVRSNPYILLSTGRRGVVERVGTRQF